MTGPAPAGRAVSSLTYRLLRAMALPMLALALALGVGGAWAIEEMVESVNDRILGAASRAIAESLTVESGEIYAADQRRPGALGDEAAHAIAQRAVERFGIEGQGAGHDGLRRNCSRISAAAAASASAAPCERRPLLSHLLQVLRQ